MTLRLLCLYSDELRAGRPSNWCSIPAKEKGVFFFCIASGHKTQPAFQMTVSLGVKRLGSEATTEFKNDEAMLDSLLRILGLVLY